MKREIVKALKKSGIKASVEAVGKRGEYYVTGACFTSDLWQALGPIVRDIRPILDGFFRVIVK